MFRRFFMAMDEYVFTVAGVGKYFDRRIVESGKKCYTEKLIEKIL